MARGNAKKKLLDATIQLMLARGYSATKVEEICRAAAVSKGSLYHFFPTKEDLALAALDQFLLRGRRILLAGAYQSEEDPVKRMFGFLTHVRDHAGALWKDGCLLGNFITDLASTDSGVRVHVAERFSHLAKGFAPLLAPAAGRPGPTGSRTGSPRRSTGFGTTSASWWRRENTFF